MGVIQDSLNFISRISESDLQVKEDKLSKALNMAEYELDLTSRHAANSSKWLYRTRRCISQRELRDNEPKANVNKGSSRRALSSGIGSKTPSVMGSVVTEDAPSSSSP